MDKALDEAQAITSRLIRLPDKQPADSDWSKFTPEERMEAVWILTKACLAWGDGDVDELRLDRTVTRVQREQR